MKHLSDPTRGIMARIHEADAAIERGDMAEAERIRDELQCGEQMEQFGAEVVANAITNAARARRPTVDDLRRMYEANGDARRA